MVWKRGGRGFIPPAEKKTLSATSDWPAWREPAMFRAAIERCRGIRLSPAVEQDGQVRDKSVCGAARLDAPG
ncbi:hypothetical protein X737_14145 [Mesorhizobium sp. L48C026A00]|nr:hypothetical protein X737_14145 [Mesorhizobium sp. L48C026A00]